MNLTFMTSRSDAVLSKIIDISRRYTVVFIALLAVVFVFFHCVSSFSSSTSKDAFGDLSGEVITVDFPKDGARFGEDLSCLSNSDISVSAQAAILCTSGGQTLYEKNSSDQLPMASITKVMTAVLVMENIRDLDKEIFVSEQAQGIEGSSVYLKAGDKVAVRSLLYALLLASANDAAVALAIECSGSVDNFVDLMNSKAIQIGMNSTSFDNPHGLSSSKHYTTARDFALLMAYAIDNAEFRAICGTVNKEITVNGESRYLRNHNKLQYSCEGMICGKTGYTVASGRTLVTATERNGITLICVTLNAQDDWNDHRKLYDAGFLNVYVTEYSKENLSVDIPVTGGPEATVVAAIPEKNIKVVSKYCYDTEIKYSYPRFLYAPLTKGEQIGEIRILAAGDQVCSVPLVAVETVDSLSVKQRSFIEWLKFVCSPKQPVRNGID